MNVFFSGIGGTGIGPLALIAKEAGYAVSGSDKQDSGYIEYLRKKGISDIHIGQTKEALRNQHESNPIDWFVYSSALEKENPNHPELVCADELEIKKSKRDEFINLLLQEKKLKMIGVAGTHGKSTTTAMVIWLFKQLKIPVSYSVGAKISFGDMGHYDPKSEYFVYEADEFDRNFLAFHPYLSLITGVTWDHHEIFPTEADYQQAFKDFISQSQHTILWADDSSRLDLSDDSSTLTILGPDPIMSTLTLPGVTNRQDAQLAIKAVSQLSNEPLEKLLKIINKFPGLQRRMEQLIPNLYSDYAHTPEKIRGGLGVALEMASKKNQNVVVVYEGLTNRRQHYMIDDYKDCFDGAKKVYWIPSYQAREDPDQRIIPPTELIAHLSNPAIAVATRQDNKLKHTIQSHLANGDMVVAMTGGGGNSLDEWLRKEFAG